MTVTCRVSGFVEDQGRGYEAVRKAQQRAETTPNGPGPRPNARDSVPECPPTGQDRTEEKREGGSPQLMVARTREEGNSIRSLTERDHQLGRATTALGYAWEACGRPGEQPKHTDVVRVANGVDGGVALAAAEMLAAEAAEGLAGASSSVIGVFRARLLERGAA
jgi:hypothetical protein